MGVARVWSTSDGRALGELRGHSDAVSNAVFSRDGRRIATASHDGTARIWDAATLQSTAVLSGHAGHLNRVAFIGDRVVTAGDDATVRVWDAASGREQRALSEHSGAVYGLDVSPDGRQL